MALFLTSFKQPLEISSHDLLLFRARQINGSDLMQCPFYPRLPLCRPERVIGGKEDETVQQFCHLKEIDLCEYTLQELLPVLAENTIDLFSGKRQVPYLFDEP